MENDQIDEELNKAEIDVNKSINMTKYKHDILNRPKKYI